jgi:hypothetical protein
VPEQPTSNPQAVSRRDFLQVAGSSVALAAVPAQLRVGSAFPPPSQFALQLDAGAIVSLKRVGDAYDTEYVQSGRRLGDVAVKYRRGTSAWDSIDTTSLTERRVDESADGTRYNVTYALTTVGFQLDVAFVVHDGAIEWRIDVENLSGTPLEIGDLAIPLPMNGDFRRQPQTAVLKHGVVSGHGSFFFWMRRNSVGPYLLLTPDARTSLEYTTSRDGAAARASARLSLRAASEASYVVRAGGQTIPASGSADREVVIDVPLAAPTTPVTIEMHIR